MIFRRLDQGETTKAVKHREQMILKTTLRSMAPILIFQMGSRSFAFTGEKRRKEFRKTYLDISLTCISYNNVLKKICVRHFND